jgi:hypothetical protein
MFLVVFPVPPDDKTGIILLNSTQSLLKITLMPVKLYNLRTYHRTARSKYTSSIYALWFFSNTLLTELWEND